jgi:cysteine desulfurase
VLECLDYLERIHGFSITWLPVDSQGAIGTDAFFAALRPDTTLVTLMLANNEVGAIHPISEIADYCQERRIPLHTDAVQAPGWMDLNVQSLGVSALSLSGHKFGAPKGSGLVYLSNRLTVEPVLHGGGQEFGKRSGT